MMQFKIGMFIAIVAASFVAGTAAGWTIKRLQSDAAYSALQKDFANYKADVGAVAVKAAQDALQKQQDLSAQIAAIDEVRSQEKRDAEKKYADLMDCIRTGKCRVRLPAIPTPAVPGVPENSGPGLGDGKEGGELHAEAAADLFGIGRDCDAIVYQLTACQEIILAATSSLSGTTE